MFLSERISRLKIKKTGRASRLFLLLGESRVVAIGARRHFVVHTELQIEAAVSADVVALAGLLTGAVLLSSHLVYLLCTCVLCKIRCADRKILFTEISNLFKRLRKDIRMVYHYGMEKRKKEVVSTDGNGATVAKEESKFTKFMRIKRILSICFNFVYIIAYMAFTVFTFAGDNAEITWLPYLFAGFILFYMVLFIVSLVMAKNERRQKNAVKDYKSGLKIVKKLLKLVNLALAIVLVVNAASGDRNLFSLIISCVSVVYVLYQVFAEIRKIIKRRKKLKIKEKKDECDKKFIDDVKRIWNGEEAPAENAEQSSATDTVADDEVAAAASETVPAGESVPATAAAVPAATASAEVEEKTSKKGVSAKISALGKTASKKLDDAKKSALSKVEEVRAAADKAKKIGTRAIEYYGERKKIDEEMSSKKKKKDDKK